MIYAVIDTNVFVSAYITHNNQSATAQIVERLLQGKITPLYNEEIMAEYEEVLSREHFHISLSTRQTLFDYIRKNGIAEERMAYYGVFIDEDDRVFYEIALSEEDSFLVTGNLKHYPISPKIVTPVQMMQIIESAL